MWTSHQLYMIQINFNNFVFLTVGAPTLFTTLLSAVTTERHSEKRINVNKKRIVSVIYTLCFCLSQQCNNLQVDHGLYLNSSRINQEGIDTQHRLRDTCCRRTVNNLLDSLATNHIQQLGNFITAAIGKLYNCSNGKRMAFGTNHRRLY